MFNVGDTLLKLATESGFAGFFANGGWQNLVMIVIACVLPRAERDQRHVPPRALERVP